MVFKMVWDYSRMSAWLSWPPFSRGATGFAFEKDSYARRTVSKEVCTTCGLFPDPDFVYGTSEKLAYSCVNASARLGQSSVSLFDSQEMSEFYEDRLMEAGVSIEKNVTAERLWGLEEQVKRLSSQETKRVDVTDTPAYLFIWPGDERKSEICVSSFPYFAPMLSSS